MPRRVVALPVEEDSLTEIVVTDLKMGRPNKKWRTFVCPKCGRTTETLGWSVLCRGKPPNWHESAECKEQTPVR